MFPQPYAAMPYDDDEPDYESYEGPDDDDELSDENQEVIEHLRDTLTTEMALKAWRCRNETEPSDAELFDFMDELVSEHFNAGLDEWDDEFLYWD